MKRQNQIIDEKNLVECQVCLNEIPESAAKSEEANDYVRYFCGLECFDAWRKKIAQNQKQDDP